MKKMFVAAGVLVLSAVSLWAWTRRPTDGSAPAAQVPGLERLRVLGEESGIEWSGIRAGAFLDDDLVVITQPAPGVHVFSNSGHRAWGREGSGPAELQDPSMVAISGDHVLVYDLELAKVASYARDGSFAGTRQVGIINGLFTTGRDTIVGSGDIMGGTRRVLRLRGPRVDTLYEYQIPPRLELTAPGSPSYSVVSPYTPVPQWAALPDGRLAIWDATTPYLEIRSLANAPPVTYPLASTRYDVAAADRELWLKEAIPSEFMGQRVFEPLREKARRSVAFPRELPAVLSIKGDPLGGVWVQGTTSATGEVWTLLDEDGVRASFRLPAGRRLLAIGKTQFAALVRNADDVESVEIYRNPRP